MRVDFYQLGAAHPDSVIAAIGGRLLGEGQRLLVVASDEGLLARLDRQLWDQGPASFLPHGLAGGSLRRGFAAAAAFRKAVSAAKRASVCC